MEFTIDARELFGFADAMAQADGVFQQELEASSFVALHEGVGYAKENAPVGDGDGNLRGDIRILEGPDASGGSYGSDLVYAWQREEGGDIYPRNGEFLWFEIDGQLIRARKVTQTGTKYMERSADQLEPRIVPIYLLSVDRTLGRI